MNVDILMPIATFGCEWRERAYRYTVDHYRRSHPTWHLIIGTSDIPWSKGAAIANAFDISEADMLVLADADSFVDRDVLCAAVAAARADGWAMPHAMVHRLSQRATEAVYAGAPVNLADLDRGAYRGVKGGGIVAITRDAYETVGGIDPRFEGWGGEDLSLAYALDTLVTTGARMGGDLIHLWHPHPAPNLRGSPEAEVLVDRYLKARHKPDVIRALIAERQQVRL